MREGNLSFYEWANLLVKAENENGYVGVIYSVATIFRDVIFKELEFFPYLFLFGDAGAGKTSFAEFLLSLFYNDYKGISL